MIFDTHAHYDSGAFNADRFEILASMPQKNVGLIVNPGCDLESSLEAIALAEKFDFVYAAVGWHPEDMDKLTEESLAELKKLAEHLNASPSARSDSTIIGTQSIRTSRRHCLSVR